MKTGIRSVMETVSKNTVRVTTWDSKGKKKVIKLSSKEEKD